MKPPTVDLIQIFCANFDCDLDLRYPPGVVKRFKSHVRWPNLKSTNLFSDLAEYDRNAQIHRLEIHLKRSRYSVEVMNLVLSSSESLVHLEMAIREHYSKTSIDVSFHPDMIILALKALDMLPSDLDETEAVASAVEKYHKWLARSIEKVAR